MRAAAMLDIPAGATITHAFLYWAAGTGIAAPDMTATFGRQGVFSTNVTANASFIVSNRYQSMADVTSIVQMYGTGGYEVSNVLGPTLTNINDNNHFAGWWMAVIYEKPSDPLRSILLFDGLDEVQIGNPVTSTLSGFMVPNGPFDAKLGVIGYDGDGQITGDEVLVNGVAITDAQNPANNFFNGTRSTLGAGTHFPGDLPELTGTPQSMSGIDIDIVDIVPRLAAGQTSMNVSVSTTSDVVLTGGFVTSISTFAPNFDSATKTAVDLNGGVVLPGDTIEYTISLTNTGDDTATNVVLTDVLPIGVTFVPGSLRIAQGANAGIKSDMSGDDQGEYVSGSRTITVRLGTGADATMGGTMAPSGMTTVAFGVIVDADALGPIQNQATINAASLGGLPPSDTLTDGNGADPGRPTTTITVAECMTNAHCTAPMPYCSMQNECTECLVDAHCPGLFPTCDPLTDMCMCVPSGSESCDGKDNNCNGQIDDGFNVGTTCSAGIGQCQANGTILCDGNGSAVCNAIPGTPAAEVCDGIDNDCNGTTDEGFNLGVACTNGTGACQTNGTILCDGNGGAVCNAIPGTPAAEVCDGIDNNCNGATDEGFNLGVACTNGTGACQANGTIVCNGNGGAVCNAIPSVPGTEVCTDGVDNDCDGSIDEDCSTGGCEQDSDCGSASSGQICELTMSEGKCIPGCRGMMGNGCPEGQTCSSANETPGTCSTPQTPTGPASNGGCDCRMQRTEERFGMGFWCLGAGVLAAFARRRRRLPTSIKPSAST